jgi:hypothetical protein
MDSRAGRQITAKQPRVSLPRVHAIAEVALEPHSPRTLARERWSSSKANKIRSARNRQLRCTRVLRRLRPDALEVPACSI